jgi:flagellar biosynthetic protein FlhB
MSAQSGDKTEKATPKRKREAREKGQVVKSTELTTALSLAVMFGVISIFGGQMVEGMRGLLRHFFSNAGPEELTIASVGASFKDATTMFLQIMLPFLGAALLVGVVFNVLQSGFVFSTKALAPKLDRISPLSGFKRIFSKRTLIDLLKALLKTAVLGYVAYSEFESRMGGFPALMAQEVTFSTASFVDTIIAVAFKLAIAMAIIGPFDYLYQWWKHNKDLMMTKQEVKDEYKLTEGNPQTKGRISQKQRQMSRMRMMQAVKDADVIITNPTHYAIALSYKEDKNGAPVVVAKGKDYLAQKIKERARECSVEIVENRQLARALYFFCNVGDEVPEDLYKAVAEVLAYVYRMKKGGRRS